MSAHLRPRAQTVFGRPDGPVRAVCEVVGRRPEGAYVSLTVAAPQIAERALPGQFVNVAVECRGALLRRPFSIYRTSRQGPWVGTVEFILDPHGPGTAWLAERAPHEVLDVVGPLGNVFPVPAQRVPCLLVGGGYGAAPLFFLAERLRAEGQRVAMLLGAATGERIFNAIEAKRTSANVTFTTDDGSYGIRGRVTDALPDVARDGGTGVVYACGPMPMLREVARVCGELRLPCQVAVEEHMACATGVCWTCVVPLRGKDGRVRMKRSCVDGPVFNGARVAWDESRWVPAPVDEEFLPNVGAPAPQVATARSAEEDRR
ncbi:MAG: dihydroorotate dehydrogenase electron transfer subunit [Actinomycetota bacterium]|nr:dihydroorotate dehydrogenase electron transfer subunit [Actinomycetota bacterium]